jgi:sugar lactone lactonase YvrE
LLVNAQIKHRFLKEAAHMQQLKHPGIVPVLEISESDEGPYFVMPYLEEGNLSRRIAPEKPMDPAAILDIAIPVAEGLQFAHRRGIIHRDLKPGNVLLAADGSACLADFGLARTVFNDTIVDAGTEQCEGTAPYMSPAVAEGHAEDTRCDIYAFGALLYEMQTGTPPYEGATTLEVRRKIIAGPPAPLRSLNPKADDGLAAIAEGAMARLLRDRYADMSDVVADLKRVRSGKRPLGPHGMGRRIRDRLGSRPAIVGVFFAMLVAAGVYFVAALHRNKGPAGAQAAGAGASGAQTKSSAAGAGAVQPVATPFHFRNPTGLAFDPDGNLYVSDQAAGVIYQLLPGGRNDSERGFRPAQSAFISGTAAAVAGKPGFFGGLDGLGDAARFSILRGLTFDPTGFIFYITDGFRIRMLSLHGPVWTLAGSFGAPGSTDGPVRQARFRAPSGIAIDKAGNLYVADVYTIRKVTPEGTVSTMAGLDGHAGRTDGSGSAARFSDQEKAIAVGGDGTVYVTDGFNHHVRKISPDGAVTTLPAVFARPGGVAIDRTGNLYVADTGNDTIAKVGHDGLATLIAGQAGKAGNQDGVGSAAAFNRPKALAVDSAGVIWVADVGNQAVRRVTPAGAVTTVSLSSQ